MTPDRTTGQIRVTCWRSTPFQASGANFDGHEILAERSIADSAAIDRRCPSSDVSAAQRLATQRLPQDFAFATAWAIEGGDVGITLDDPALPIYPGARVSGSMAHSGNPCRRSQELSP
jgi:hypothetical protein